MSELLDGALDPDRRAACKQNEEAADAWLKSMAAGIADAHPLKPGTVTTITTYPRRLFTVNIGPRENPRLSYSVMARSVAEAVEDNLCLAHDGERVEAYPAGKRAETFAVVAERQALEAARMRDAIPEAERVAADLARNVNKGSRLAAVNDAHALDLQVQFSGHIGELPQ